MMATQENKYLADYAIDPEKSYFSTSNRDYTKMLKDFGGTEVLSVNQFVSNYYKGLYERVNANIRIDKVTGVKELWLEECEDEASYYLFMCYFK